MGSSLDADVGLCARCRHSRQVLTRSSRFWFCERSRQDKSFDRYPRLPMLACRGFEESLPGGAGTPVDRDEPESQE